MTTETGRISQQTQGANSPLSTGLIHNHLEKVAVIAGAVASFALAIFALIGSAYLMAALSAAAGLSILYAFMKGEGTPDAPIPSARPVPPIAAPIATQPAELNTGTNSGTPVQPTLAAQSGVEGSTTSVLQPLSLTDSDEGSFLRRRTPSKALSRTSGSDAPPSEAPQSPNTIIAFVAGAPASPLAHVLGGTSETNQDFNEISPFKFSINKPEADALDEIFSGMGEDLLDKPKDNALGQATTKTRARAASHDELTSPYKRDLQGLGSQLQMEPISEDTRTTTSGANGFRTPPPKRKQLPPAFSIATRPLTGTPALGQAGTTTYSEFIKSGSKNPAGLPRSPSDPEFKRRTAYRTLGTPPIGVITAASFENRSFKDLTSQVSEKKQ
jgi:hypothetical protein